MDNVDVTILDNLNASTDPDIVALAGLSPMDYDRVRESKAQALGVRVSTLDKEVAKLRVAEVEEQEEDVVEHLEPWSEPVDGNDLLHEITNAIEPYVVMQDGCTTAACVWALGTFCMDAFRLFPKLQIKSPEKRCGKSTLLECLETVTCRSLMASNITASSLFRSIEAWRPTLLIDEADTFAKDNDEINGIINAGHTRRHAFVIRTVKINDEHQPRKFSVWGAQAIAGIKSQRDTLEDRSVTIEMRRKLPGERTRRLPVNHFEMNRDIRRKCLRWAEDHVAVLKKISVIVEPCGNDRAQDNWEPLVAIAEVVGGGWPGRLLESYRLIEGQSEDEDSVAVMLLADIKQIFEKRGITRIHSEILVKVLITMDGRPWADWRHGKPITANSISRLLKPFKIRSRQLRIGAVNRNGYSLESFNDAINRYVPKEVAYPTATTLQPSTGTGFRRFQNATQVEAVAFLNPRKPSTGAGCSIVAFENTDTKGNRP